MRIAIIGANGQLGSDLVEALAGVGEVIPLTHEDIAIENPESVERMFAMHHPAIVINTAAFHNVDLCEEVPNQAFAVNAVGARNLAWEAARWDTYVIHISTDYVFDGRKGQPYVESDAVFPLNVYGNTKVSGEFFLLSLHSKAAVVRTSGLYGRSPCRAKSGRNFVEMMLWLAKKRDTVKVVTDEIVSPTATHDLARQIRALVRHPQYGVIHATAEGACSWYEFARTIFDMTQTKVKLIEATSADFPKKTPRPAYSVLENARLKSAGIHCMKHWREALKEYLTFRGYLKV